MYSRLFALTLNFLALSPRIIQTDGLSGSSHPTPLKTYGGYGRPEGQPRQNFNQLGLAAVNTHCLVHPQASAIETDSHPLLPHESQTLRAL